MKWLKIKDNPPDFRKVGFYTGAKVTFRAGDGEHEGIYWGWGVFNADGRRGTADSYDACCPEGDPRKVTHWMHLTRTTRGEVMSKQGNEPVKQQSKEQDVITIVGRTNILCHGCYHWPSIWRDRHGDYLHRYGGGTFHLCKLNDARKLIAKEKP